MLEIALFPTFLLFGFLLDGMSDYFG